MAFCKAAGAGGNHLVAVTAGGKRLGDGQGRRGHVSLREKSLAPLLEEFKNLPASERKPVMPDPNEAKPSKRPVPAPPPNGLIMRGYCTYMKQEANGVPKREKHFYYKENPDAWAAETQSDMLWLTEGEWHSLIPETLQKGAEIMVSEPIQRRFFSTIGIDYMEGSVNALPVRESKLTIHYESKAKDGTHRLRLVGWGKMGKAQDPNSKMEPRTRGCELRVIGRISLDRSGQRILAFDIAGVGEAWGNKMEYTGREIRIPGDRWTYGIACELVTSDSPYDRIPPYNLLHYGGGMKYFARTK